MPCRILAACIPGCVACDVVLCGSWKATRALVWVLPRAKSCQVCSLPSDPQRKIKIRTRPPAHHRRAHHGSHASGDATPPPSGRPATASSWDRNVLLDGPAKGQRSDLLVWPPGGHSESTYEPEDNPHNGFISRYCYIGSRSASQHRAKTKPRTTVRAHYHAAVPTT